MKTIALVGCAKGKLDRPAPARELYTSPHFRMTVDYAERVLGADATYILSARHGVVHPDRELEPYDLSIGNFNAEELAEYRHVTGIQLGDALGVPTPSASWPPVRVVLLASPAYLPDLPPTVVVEQPLKGLQIGERLHWLRERLTAGRAA